MNVRKRNGDVVAFDVAKIIDAISKANQTVSAADKLSSKQIEAIASNIERKCSDFSDIPTVEQIQDMVERGLVSEGKYYVSKAYILYREHHKRLRESDKNLLNYKDLVDNYLRVNDWRVKENSTVSYSLGGLILSNSGAITANYWLSEVYDEEIGEAHRNADIHLHDLSMLTPYCGGWNLKQLIQEGLGGVPGKIASAPASHLSTLCNQMVNFLGILQNEWAGISV